MYYSNTIDIFSQHVFVLILSSHRMDFMISGWNWQIKLS